MSIFTIRPSAVAAAALLAVASVGAQAASVSYSASKSLTTTNWSDALSFAQFDTSLGTLNSITFDLSGSVTGDGSAESKDAAASVVSLQLGSVITLSRPDQTKLVVANPVFTQNFNFSAYDSKLDFAGTSGGTTGTVTASNSNSATYTTASDLALFSKAGGGTISLGISAAGASTATGAGNLVTSFDTAALANAKVTYNYTAAVPEPETYALMLAGLGLMGAVARRRRAAR